MTLLRTVHATAPAWVKRLADMGTRQYALATAADRPLPDYLIIGCKRGGTTSLFNYLVRHPGILQMFPQVRGKKSTDFFFPGNGRSPRWYRSHVPTERHRRHLARTLGYRPISGEASPYYVWDPRVAPAVRAVAPDVRAIMLVRDPVRRAWSHYQERVQNGVEPLSFCDALDAEDERLSGERERMAADPTYYSKAFDFYSYRSRGEYLGQIINWRSHFEEDRLLVLRAEDLYTDTQATFDAVCDYLSVPRLELLTRSRFNATWRTRDLPPDAEAAQLASHFAPHNAALAKYLGRDLAWEQDGP